VHPPSHTTQRTVAPKRHWLTGACALALLLGCPPASADDTLTEVQVKAAYVFNFVKFVEWPAGAFATPQAPLVLCVASGDGLRGAFAAIDGKQAQGRPMQVRRGVKADEFKACHVLFVPESEERAAPEHLRRVGTLPVLTVGEHDGFAASGGVIGFVIRDDRVQFEINPDAANRADLKVSSRLLQLATIVRDARRSTR
jgi:hypothetical protein